MISKEGIGELLGLAPKTDEGQLEGLLTFSNLKDTRWEKMDELFALGIIKPGVWVAGGSLQTLVKPNIPVKDFDLFFSHPTLLEETKAKLVEAGYGEVFACPKGELFTYMNVDSIPVQLIAKFYYPSMIDLIDSFDFTATQWATDGDTVLTTKRAIKDTKAYRILIHKVTFPVATLNRMFKYQRKGFNVEADTLIDYVDMVSSQKFDADHMALYID